MLNPTHYFYHHQFSNQFPQAILQALWRDLDTVSIYLQMHITCIFIKSKRIT